MVRPGRPEATEGVLTLGAGELAFREQGGYEVALPLDRILGARRRPGTPVLVVRYRDRDDRPARLFFFFTRPPPLPTGRTVGSRRVPFVPSPKGLERTASMMTLRAAALEARATIRTWVKALRGAVAEARS